MTIIDILSSLKVYLNIPDDDTSIDEYLTHFCSEAAAYISVTYRYNILEQEVHYKKLFVSPVVSKVYLPECPLKTGSEISTTDPDGNVVPIAIDSYNGVVVFKERFSPRAGLYTFTYISESNDPRDVHHCVQLAGYLYRMADKGLEGMSQISTGVKESVKTYDHIPRTVSSYFEARQPMRL